MIQFLRSIEAACAWFGRAVGWFNLVLIFAVCIAVVMVQLRMNVLVEWPVTLPLLGPRMTMNGMIDLQWHLFAAITMLGGVYAMHTDSHVCVDFLAARFSPRTKLWVRLFGDVVLLTPFCAIMTFYAWRFAMSAFTSNEGSSYGGLMDTWIIKGVMPLGFGLLTIFGVARSLRAIVELAQGRQAEA
ncbi:TRAP transporter small permease subunit [Ferrovibrio sp.]|uniref:TRAP transporter small permease subunit n=1 Tax=Ferrovibrio sp. TaxID=1917215 RepID=UPI001B45E510|nr:TRAP transporter small permease subunit [Ferrovibrio sp.]MBP7064301.1 TRAP transporter small permease subunit [Ferrovibrio sp.]